MSHSEPKKTVADDITSHSMLGAVATLCAVAAVVIAVAALYMAAQGTELGVVGVLVCLVLFVQVFALYAFFQGFSDHIKLQIFIAKTLNRMENRAAPSRSGE